MSWWFPKAPPKLPPSRLSQKARAASWLPLRPDTIGSAGGGGGEADANGISVAAKSSGPSAMTRRRPSMGVMVTEPVRMRFDGLSNPGVSSCDGQWARAQRGCERVEVACM